MAWRLLIGLTALALLMLGAAWMADRPGQVSIDWLGYRLETNVGLLAAAAVVAGLAVALLYLLWRGLIGAPGAWFGRRSQRRQRKGLRALGLGMVAVAAGDSDEAARQARRAENLLDDSPLTRLLAAQSAQLKGDTDAARRYFTAMLGHPETAFLGLRGLLMQSMREGDRPKALQLAERAYALKPNTPWVVHALFDMQVRSGQWNKAQETLQGGLRHKSVTAEKGRSLKSMLLVERSRQAERAGNGAEALQFAREAFAAEPERIVVAYRYADRLIHEDHARKARKIIKQAWLVQPHPDLAKLYLSAIGESDPSKRLRALEALTAANPNHIESHLVLAQEALEARLWGEARRHLAAAAGDDPSVRVCALMADLEEQEHGNGEAVRRWLTRATHAPIDKHWRCLPCGMVVERWQSVCPNCGAFGSIDWRAPPAYRAADDGQARKPQAVTPPPRVVEIAAPAPAPAKPDASNPDSLPASEPARPPETNTRPQPRHEEKPAAKPDLPQKPEPVQMPPRIDPLA